MLIKNTYKIFNADSSELESIRDFVIQFLTGSVKTEEKTVNNFILAIDEACANVIDHGYPVDKRLDIHIELKEFNDHFEVTLRDKAPPFNPLLEKSPDLKRHAEQYRTRGLGICMMTMLVDDIIYEYEKDRGNRLTFIQYKADEAIPL